METNEIMKTETTAIMHSGTSEEIIKAAAEKARIESRLVIANRFPRNWDEIRTNLLAAAKRPGFAGRDGEKTAGCAWYKLPFGDGAEGFSIRMAEEVLAEMGNIDVVTSTVWEDENTRRIRVTVFDLQKNTDISSEATIEKTVEKKYPKKDNKKNVIPALRTRTTADGQTNYIYAADERDMAQKQGAVVSKLMRNAIMRLCPGHIKADLQETILRQRHGEVLDDPIGARKKIIDAFATIGVKPADLNSYLDHDIGSSSPRELANLRELYDSIKKGEVVWSEEYAQRIADRNEVVDIESEKEEDSAKKVDTLKDKLRTPKEA